MSNLEAEKTVIFISNENKRAIPYYKESGNGNDVHTRAFHAYLTKNNLAPIIGNPYEIATSLATNYDIVTMYREEDYLICFMPKELSAKQKRWFEKNYHNIKDYNLSINDTSKKDTEDWCLDDVSLGSREAVFSKLQELVTTRTIEGKYK
jgi:hypothetical protein